MTQDLLIECGTEELPPKALKGLSEAFLSGVCTGLEQHKLNYDSASPYATPRRLAVLVKGVVTQQPDYSVEKRGPALGAAFDKNGQPTQAAMGFARSCNVDVADLETVQSDKGSWLVHRHKILGQNAVTLVPNIVETALANLPIPKRMRWGNLPFEFVRPVHWIVLLFGEQVIETHLLGVTSGRVTYGHRFHHPEPLIITQPSEYVELLENSGFVMPVFAVRREKIRTLVQQAAEQLSGEALLDEELLDEVTSLVEFPVVVSGAFEEKFLTIPPEALIAVMKDHQRYFPVLDKQGKLLPRFITISNIQSLQPEVVKVGNERVLRPRLSDAAFFWQQDCAKSLESRLEQLKTVIFQNKLGSLYEKAKRVAQLTGIIAKQLGVEELQGIRAAQLAKCDLMTSMVGEFPELQGIMGEYYARHDGETQRVAVAIREQYLPRFAGDVLPTSLLGQALAIADRIDTLIGIFGIGQAPTGDKDPFSLRRAAIAILRILIECGLSIDLQALLQTSQLAYPKDLLGTHTSNQVFEFMLERLHNYYQEKGVNFDSVEAVLACRPAVPLEIDGRIRGVEAFRRLPDAVSLATANKRIHNILKKAEESFPNQPDPTYFNHAAERFLYDQMEVVNAQMQPLLKQRDYQAALQCVAFLREAVDKFFDSVMVMDNDVTVRKNRLAFLQAVRNIFLQVADISRLQMAL